MIIPFRRRHWTRHVGERTIVDVVLDVFVGIMIALLVIIVVALFLRLHS